MKTTGELRLEKWFSELVRAWAKADRECQKTFAAWGKACDRRVALARAKNRVWADLEKKRAARGLKRRKSKP